MTQPDRDRLVAWEKARKRLLTQAMAGLEMRVGQRHNLLLRVDAFDLTNRSDLEALCELRLFPSLGGRAGPGADYDHQHARAPHPIWCSLSAAGR